MTAKRILFRSEARERILRGAGLLVDAVRGLAAEILRREGNQGYDDGPGILLPANPPQSSRHPHGNAAVREDPRALRLADR